MSNHEGSHMLNEVLTLMYQNHLFDGIPRKKILDIVTKIVRIGYDYDGNPGEILDDIGMRLGICYYCLEYGENLSSGMCEKCRNQRSPSAPQTRRGVGSARR